MSDRHGQPSSSRDRQSHDRPSHGGGASSSSSSSSVRRVIKKIETCKRETAKLQKGVDELEQSKKKAKYAAHAKAEEAKADFVRTAAVVQRQIDEDTDECKRLQAEIERDEADVAELRRKLREQSESNSQQREQMELASQERLAELRDEIKRLNEYGRGRSAAAD